LFSRRSSAEPQKNPPTIALERILARGESVLDLCLGNPTHAELPYDEPAILGALARTRALDYSPDPLGLATARKCAAKLWRDARLEVDPRRVVMSASTSEAYGFIFKLLCDAEDEVLAPRPSYPLLEHLAQFDLVRLVPYRLRYDGAWHLDLDSIRRAITDRTRAIIVINPNNPTGSFLKHAELHALGELGVPIVSDEVFSSYPLASPADRVRSALELDRTLVFAMGGLSKLAALPQMKLAWTALGGPAALVDEALSRLEIIADTYLSTSTVVQQALPELLAATAPTHAAISVRLSQNLGQLRQELRGSAATLLHVEGGHYAVIKLPNQLSEDAWVLELLEKDHVWVQPGYFFDFESEPFVVVSLLTPPNQLSLGIERLVRRVQKVLES
jgi:hypothetical protein